MQGLLHLQLIASLPAQKSLGKPKTETSYKKTEIRPKLNLKTAIQQDKIRVGKDKRYKKIAFGKKKPWGQFHKTFTLFLADETDGLLITFQRKLIIANNSSK